MISGGGISNGWLHRLMEYPLPDGMLLADEHVYFLTWRPPPSGMELADSHKLEFPPATAALFHLPPKSESDRRIKAGTYDTVETCEDDEEDVQALG
jgi:hypothetical protein